MRNCLYWVIQSKSKKKPKDQLAEERAELMSGINEVPHVTV